MQRNSYLDGKWHGNDASQQQDSNRKEDSPFHPSIVPGARRETGGSSRMPGMRRRFRVSLRLLLLLLAAFAVVCAWYQARQDRLRAEHEARVANLRTRLVFVDEFLGQYRRQLSDPQGDHAEAAKMVSKYEEERRQLIERIEW
jgi:hypothetical protein